MAWKFYMPRFSLVSRFYQAGFHSLQDMICVPDRSGSVRPLQSPGLPCCYHYRNLNRLKDNLQKLSPARSVHMLWYSTHGKTQIPRATAVAVGPDLENARVVG